MPNWCNNTMTISHNDPAMIARAREAWMNHKFLTEFIPCPQELIDTIEGFVGDDKQAELNAKQAANIKKYGYPTWYRFALGEWGTKWDIGYDNDYENNPYDETPNGFTAYFDSAWSPPVDAYYTPKVVPTDSILWDVLFFERVLKGANLSPVIVD